MTGFRVPAATYRLQFHHGFRFITAQALVPYLHDLGISDLYASPFFKARRRSLHGYSVTNPLEINPELGSRVSLRALRKVLKSKDMGLLLDIVPNHMALSHDNPWWLDVLENGPGSPYAIFFDIDWHPLNQAMEGRVLQPILGAPYGQVLENQQFTLALEEAGFFVHYYEHKFPLDPKTYGQILTHRLDTLTRELGPGSPAILSLMGLIKLIEYLPPRSLSSKRKLLERHRQKEILKNNLWLLYQGNPLIKKFLDENIAIFNGRAGDPESFDLLDRLLGLQPYRLAYWPVALDLINYRRFFSVNDLIGVRVEDPRVFEASHSLLFNLIREGKISGVRIDHIDGLYDPLGYLQRLQSHLAPNEKAPANRENLYVVVEKILAADEPLPPDWPIAGTTGYDFLNRVNGLFIDAQGFQAVQQVYNRFVKPDLARSELIYQKKKLVIETLFRGELETLGYILSLLAEQDRQARDVPRKELQKIIGEVIACLPVYRTYIRSFEVSPRDRACLEQVIEEVRTRHPSLDPTALDFVRRVLLLDFPPNLSEEHREDWLRFVMRWQQFTVPIMAKGLEDTALYVYNPLVSLNEVGTDFLMVAPEDFHQFNQRRQENWPSTLNATATHDTKRSEDVRMRINVLSEDPQKWEACLQRWSAWNQPKKRWVNGMAVPDANEEYFLYQTLIGAWPLLEEEIPEFKERLQAYTIKAAREAKVHTRWIAPNHEHENALTAFTEAILHESNHNEFLNDFQKIQARLAYYGALNSLSQVLLKIASPGVPDFYQGTELWDFSLVDPDNRRPVDFPQRAQLLHDVKMKEKKAPGALIRELLPHWQNGAVKLYTTYKALNFRKAHPDLFLLGDYIPIMTKGPHSQQVVAFARRQENFWAVVAVARLFTKILSAEAISFDPEVWQESFLSLPDDAPKELVNIFTGETIKSLPHEHSNSLDLANLFQNLPVALLFGRAD
ncbi:MAG: malto-oligosyltrehalose synthase [Proteobacteria bacterium]|nr:malto-oligosyltrehalose synthase [Pseudomonadota bacterium]